VADWSSPWLQSSLNLRSYKYWSTHQKSFLVFKLCHPRFFFSIQDTITIESMIPNPQLYAQLTLSVTKDAEAIRAVLKAYEQALNTDSADAAGASDP
jgi:hypothetical protein